MSLDVPVPDPPSLSGPQSREEYEAIGTSEGEDGVGDDYRREELADVLADGAWADAFEAWADETDLTPVEFELVTDRRLLDRFDFYWDPAGDEVGYRAPTLPDEDRDDLGTGDADDVDDELDALGRIVSEVLENDYLPRDDETFGFFADEERADEYEFRDE